MRNHSGQRTQFIRPKFRLTDSFDFPSLHDKKVQQSTKTIHLMEPMLDCIWSIAITLIRQSKPPNQHSHFGFPLEILSYYHSFSKMLMLPLKKNFSSLRQATTFIHVTSFKDQTALKTS